MPLRFRSEWISHLLKIIYRVYYIVFIFLSACGKIVAVKCGRKIRNSSQKSLINAKRNVFKGSF